MRCINMYFFLFIFFVGLFFFCFFFVGVVVPCLLGGYLVCIEVGGFEIVGW